MRTAIVPSDGDSDEYVHIRVSLGLPRALWDALFDVAAQKRCSRGEALREAIEASILRLRPEAPDSVATMRRPDRIADLMQLPVLMPGYGINGRAS